jgi:ABC-type glutathione transport system ATPase component
MNATPHAVTLEGVSVRYGRGMAWSRSWFDAVRQVDLRIDAGQTVGLVGESGSGKSTLAKVCLGLLRPSEGTARLGDEAIYGIGRRRPGSLAAVLQHPEWSLNPKLSIGRSIAEPLGVAGVHGEQAAARVTQMLDHVGLNAAYATRLPHELSGGQRQRASIARALVTMPRFIVFDEAVSALDVSIQAQILNLVKTLQQEFRFAALFISHDLGAVRYVSHEVVVLRQGSVQERAPARSFYAAMANPYVRQLQTDSGLL